jgi:hypothetical protein
MTDAPSSHRQGSGADDRRDRADGDHDAEHRSPRSDELSTPSQSSAGRDGRPSNYGRFGAMILTSTVAMYLVTYLNTYAWDHVRFSETRLYMTLLMGSTMALIMLAFMLGMYSNRRINVGIVIVGVLVFAAGLWLVRSQALVEQRSYMRAMISHHSIAILTSERASIDDVRVRELADEIIEAQRREIAEMEWLIDDIATNGAAETRTEADARPVPNFTAADD